MTDSGRLPLEGIRILDMTVVWAGTYCATLLADMGAEVIRLESIKRLPPITRGYIPYPPKEVIEGLPAFVAAMPGREPGKRPWNRYPLFNAHGRNKLGITVDLTQPSGMDIFKRLVAVSDAFVENNVTETMDKLGISYEMMREINPRIIMLRMPAYGNTGAYRNYRSLGVHMEGVIGHTIVRGYEDMDQSSSTNVFAADAAGGAQGAFAMLAALHFRKRTGKGQLVELAQAENMIAYTGRFFMDYAMNGRDSSTIGNRHTSAIQGCYPCAGDDRWVNITLFDDGDWSAFCEAIGKPDWCSDERFSSHTEPLRQSEGTGHVYRRVDTSARPLRGHAHTAGGGSSRRACDGPARRLRRPASAGARRIRERFITRMWMARTYMPARRTRCRMRQSRYAVDPCGLARTMSMSISRCWA